MIDKLTVKTIATYPDEEQSLGPLSQFNYFYGANGSGKTTISRVISENNSGENFSISWKNNQPLQTFVYNSDFVEKNFSQSEEIKGIFTLGEKNAEILEKIELLKIEEEREKEKEGKFSKTLHGDNDSDETGKQQELTNLVNEFTLKCWEVKTKHDDAFQDAFQGVRNRKESFFAKVLAEQSNTTTLRSLEDLLKSAETLFGERPVLYEKIRLLRDSEISNLELSQILKKKIIGNSDVDIAKMIKHLGISDWVKEGKVHLESNSGTTCPFCQQSVEQNLTEQLNSFFDEAYESEITQLKQTESSYELKATAISSSIEQIIANATPLLNTSELSGKLELFKAKSSTNLARLKEKLSEPSRVIELDSTKSLLDDVYDLIDSTNKKIDEHNSTVNNFSTENQNLKKEVWKYIVFDELKLELENFNNKKAALETAIKNLQEKITESKDKQRVISSKIKELEKDVTSIKPTITEINSILTSYGFNGFKLEESSEPLHYKIVRQDGSDVGHTLSEGEKTFITFLYFHHLLKGSNSEEEGQISSDRVVVYDDPISSLDSNILFIVSSLIRQTIDEVRNNIGVTKQVFILTHNIYFHKEVTFSQKRSGSSMNEETFWIIRKLNDETKVEGYNHNPIKTSYELLWQQAKSEDKCPLTIQNILRRILENYFKIMGNMKLEDLHLSFTGKEQFMCKSLLSWVNDGSHFAHDDLYITEGPEVIDQYMNVFKEIFYRTNHKAHYDMMMY